MTPINVIFNSEAPWKMFCTAPLHIFVKLGDFIHEICILKERLGLICLYSKTYPSGSLYLQSHLKPASVVKFIKARGEGTHFRDKCSKQIIYD